ncbi:MAG: Na/Pi symporter, partial [Pygmaiobacter sp.]
SVGILQALSTTGVVTWGSAIPIILGQNIGTCSTPLIASIGASKGAKRAAVVHLYFNIIGTIVFMTAIYAIKYTIGIPFWNDVMGRGDIADFHTVFNVVTTLCFIPFTKVLAKLATITIPENEDEKRDTEMPILDERLFNSPAVAVQQARSAVEKMAMNARANYNVSVPLLFSHDMEMITQVNARENVIDKLEYYIGNYLVKASDHEPSEADSRNISDLFALITEFERIGDYSINVVERSGEIFDKGIIFSDSAKAELLVMDKAIKEIIDLAVDAFKKNDVRIAECVEPLEETIDSMCDILHNRHIARLKRGTCAIENGVVFLEIITNLERIADHCSNVAARVIGADSEDEQFDAHEMRNKLHNGYVEDYNELLASYSLKYISPIKEEK